MHFEKVSKQEWKKNGCYGYADSETGMMISSFYDNIKLPQRGTKHSAGYDFFSPYSIQMSPGSEITIPTGIRWITDESDKDKVLSIYPRSGLGFKYGIKLANTVGIIDADYCDAKNEGHIMIKLINPSDKIITISKGSAFAQGIITTYHTVDNDDATETRTGGFGSTNK